MYNTMKIPLTCVTVISSKYIFEYFITSKLFSPLVLFSPYYPKAHRILNFGLSCCSFIPMIEIKHAASAFTFSTPINVEVTCVTARGLLLGGLLCLFYWKSFIVDLVSTANDFYYQCVAWIEPAWSGVCQKRYYMLYI